MKPILEIAKVAVAIGCFACGNQTTNDAHHDTLTNPPSEFCSGSNKVESDGSTVEPAAITSALQFMNCCEAAVFRFHTKAQMGFDILATLTMAPNRFEPGQYALGESNGMAQIHLAIDNDDSPEWEWASARGSLDVIEGGDYSLPTMLTFCIEVDQPEHPLAGTRVFVNRVGIMALDWSQRFGLWLLKDPNITARDASEIPLESLELATQPVMDLLGVAYYDAGSHSLGWAEPWYTADYFKAFLPTVGVQGLPFVAIADGERVYLGAFATLLSSFLIPMPSIFVEEINSDGLTIEGSYPGSDAGQEDDLRNDPRILGVLGQAFKLVQ
ncbi:MAG: hypothetical protein A2289_20730 [Deltaproteobacteria bacterium RIFOXYA12_FULL_58_15]|nr:MAG: hypothetical protein A2289_20730 [Deltaproteobacteria bacterium RIFOXYA12_FULL_58_15]